jgi:hypothetical protein
LEAAKFIEKGKPAPVHKVLVANSLQHLTQSQYRLAVIEAVTAWEAFIRNLLAKTVIHLFKLDLDVERSVDRLIEKAGVRAVTDVVLKIISGPSGLQAELIQRTLEAVELRNNIIHHGQREVDRTRAHAAVKAVRETIACLEPFAEKPEN